MTQVLEITYGSKRRFKPYNVIIVLIMGLGSMSYGYSASIISTTLAQPSFFAYMELDRRSNANELIGLTGSLYQAGGFIGTFFVTFFADRWGRRAGIAVPALLTVVSNALLAGSVNISMFIAVRPFAGAAAYMIVSAVPLWMSEVVPANIRGPLVNVHGACIIFGFCAAVWIGYGFFHLETETLAQWRGPLAITCLPSTLLVCCLYWLPESPRWLLSKGKDTEAEQVLRRLHTPEEASYELLQIRAQAELDRTLEDSYLSLLTKPSYRKRVVLCLLTTVSVQFTGPLIVNNYGPIIYASLGFDVNTQFLYQGGWMITAFVGALLSIPLVELMPRPWLLGGGVLACLACLAMEAALVATYATTPESLANSNKSALQAAVAMFYLFVAIFNMTLDGGQFVYLSEIFPTHLRAKGIALGMAGLNIMNIIWLQVAPVAFENIGWKFYLCLIVPGSVMAVIILIWFPNTKGMPLEEAAAIFGDEVRYVAQPSRTENGGLDAAAESKTPGSDKENFSHLETNVV